MPITENAPLRRLLAPRSVAFFGGSIAEMSIRRSQDIGFTGEIWPVHPTRSELAGIKCFQSVEDLPGVPDAAYIAIRRELTIETVRALSALGVGGVVCYAAGFSESGPEGEILQAELIAAAGDMPIIGPNCFGMVNYVDQCALWPYLFGGDSVERGVAIISQSGNIAMNLTMNDRSLNITHIIAGGNQATLGPADYIEALLDDDRVSAIGMYIEGFDDVDKFAVMAAHAARKKIPIVVLKVGKTEASARQSNSHTSSLTGSDTLHDAFFDRLGVIRVNSLNRLLETLKILDLAGPLSGRNVMTLSCSGGEAAIIADLVPKVGLETKPFSSAQFADLEAQFPPYVTVSNPFDYNTSVWGDRPAMERCFTSSMNGDHDAAFLVYDEPYMDSPEVEEWTIAMDTFVVAHQNTGMPAFLTSSISELLPKATRERALAGGVVPLQGLEDGMYAYAAAARYYEFVEYHQEGVDLPRHATHVHESDQRVVMDEWASKQALAEFGLPVPAGGTSNATEVAGIAEGLGYPVVVKAVGEKFLHKTDLGVVKLNLTDEAAVVNAVAEIAASASDKGVQVEQFLVERMADAPLAELIVGVKRDEQFGPALVIGSGGILVELIADSVSLLLPATEDDIRAAIESLSVARLIQGYRGSQSGDIHALSKAISAIAAYALAHWDVIEELDVNPLLVLPGQGGVVAVDALIIHSV